MRHSDLGGWHIGGHAGTSRARFTGPPMRGGAPEYDVQPLPGEAACGRHARFDREAMRSEHPYLQ